MSCHVCKAEPGQYHAGFCMVQPDPEPLTRERAREIVNAALDNAASTGRSIVSTLADLLVDAAAGRIK